MRRVAVGLASLLAVSFTGPAAGESELDQIQDAEQPGSQINLTFGGGSGFTARRAVAARCSEVSAGRSARALAHRTAASSFPTLIHRSPAIPSTMLSPAKAPRICQAPATSPTRNNTRSGRRRGWRRGCGRRRLAAFPAARQEPASDAAEILARRFRRD